MADRRETSDYDKIRKYNNMAENAPKKIYEHGTPGQMGIVYGVGFEKSNPLHKLKQPFSVTLIEKDTAESERRRMTCYKVKAADGTEGTIDGSVLADLEIYLQWEAEYQDWLNLRNAGIASKLKIERDLLKEILIEQGFRIVSKEQAELLGIEA